jgi:hypothetical protein
LRIRVATASRRGSAPALDAVLRAALRALLAVLRALLAVLRALALPEDARFDGLAARLALDPAVRADDVARLALEPLEPLELFAPVRLDVDARLVERFVPEDELARVLRDLEPEPEPDPELDEPDVDPELLLGCGIFPPRWTWRADCTLVQCSYHR